MCNTRIDIFANCWLVKKAHEEDKSMSSITANNILRYIKVITNYGVLMSNQKNYRRETNVYGYSDSYRGGD